MPFGHDIAVFELVAAEVLTLGPDVGVDHADRTDGNTNHIHLFCLHKPWIVVVQAGQHHLLLQTAVAACPQKGVGILKVVVAVRKTTGDAARFDRFAVEGGNDADLIVLDPHQIG